MATMLERNGTFILQFVDRKRSPTVKRVNLRTCDPQTAAGLKAILEDRYATKCFDPWVSTKFDLVVKTPTPQEATCPPLSQAIRRYLEAKRMELRQATLKCYEQRLAHFEGFVGGKTPLFDITATDIRDWLRSTPSNSKVTQSGKLRQLKVFFNYWLKEGNISVNPTDKVSIGKVPQKFGKSLDEHELDQLIRFIKDEVASHPLGFRTSWLAPLVELLAFTGMRRNEALNLRWSAVNLRGRYLIVENTDTFETKTGFERKIPLANRAMAVLTELASLEDGAPTGYVFKSTKPGCEGHPLHPNVVSYRFRRYMVKANAELGIPTIPLHGLRHTCLSLLIHRGASVTAVQALSGHTTISMLNRYLSLSDQQYSREIRSAFDD